MYNFLVILFTCPRSYYHGISHIDYFTLVPKKLLSVHFYVVVFFARSNLFLKILKNIFGSQARNNKEYIAICISNAGLDHVFRMLSNKTLGWETKLSKVPFLRPGSEESSHLSINSVR